MEKWAKADAAAARNWIRGKKLWRHAQISVRLDVTEQAA
jgi:hypothetical protein